VPDGGEIEWIRSDAIKSVGWERDQLAAADEGGCVTKGGGIRPFRRNL